MFNLEQRIQDTNIHKSIDYSDSEPESDPIIDEIINELYDWVEDDLDYCYCRDCDELMYDCTCFFP
jgi:hypothetical protein